MYEVSQTYISQILSEGIKQRRINGLLDNIPFTQDDILQASLTNQEKSAGSAEISLGGVFVGQLGLTFLPHFANRIQRGTWKGRQITIQIGLKLPNGTWEDVPLKPFTIDDPTHGEAGVTVKAYDAMARFDKPIGITTTAGTLYDFLALACQICGVQLGMTQEQVEALTNGTETLSVYANNDMSTWRDLVSYCAAAAAGFATINRAGALEIRSFKTTPDITINKYQRFKGANFSDFRTYYTGVSIVNIETGEVKYYGLPEEEDTGLTMKLGSNPLLQYGTEETKTRQRRAILNRLQAFDYTPFKSSSLMDPAFDLGDVISYTEGLAGTSTKTCIMAMAYQYAKGMTLQGFGKDPAIIGAQGKTDKNINGLISKTSENEVVIHTFENAAEIELEEEIEATIIKIRFATINPRIVSIFHEILVETEATTAGGTVEAEVHYYLDGELITRTPRTSWDNDGPHIIPLMYFLNTLAGGQAYQWEVRLVIKGGTATIGRGDAIAILQGQGLVAAESWDGLLDIEDNYTLTARRRGTFGYTDSTAFIWHDAERIQISDQYELTAARRGTFGYTDSVSIITQKQQYKLITEDGDYIIGSEDGNYTFESEE